MRPMKMKTWQWIFIGALVVLTIASIVVEFSMSEGHSAQPEQGEMHEGYNHGQSSLHAEVTAPHDQVQQHAGGHWKSGIPLFWIWFGFIGCTALIVLAKNVLAHFIYKKEDYYNE